MSLIERMQKKDAPKTWIAEVMRMQANLQQMTELKNSYAEIIDVLAREIEVLREENDDVQPD